MKGGHQCTVFDLNPENVSNLAKEGAHRLLFAGRSGGEAHQARCRVGDGSSRRTHGEYRSRSADRLKPGDTIIDGGNSFYKDDVRRSKLVGEKGIHYLDVAPAVEYGESNAVTA